jgi:hypothetical protein
MVCAKCQKVLAKTELATPGVKRKNDIYFGSPTAAASSSGSGKSKTSATLGNAGISKVRYYHRTHLKFSLTMCLEQTVEQEREESLRRVLKHLYDLQDQGRWWEDLLPEMRIQSECLRHVWEELDWEEGDRGRPGGPRTKVFRKIELD